MHCEPPLLVFAGKDDGSHFEATGNLQVVETFYRLALRVCDSPIGTRASVKVYGSCNMAPVIQQYLALLMKKQEI
jgi:hypothetical protein